MSEKKKIVMIDDEPDLCLLVKGNLEETGEFNVVTHSDPLTAEALIQQEKPDLVLLDNVMKGKKGSEIAQALKKKDETKEIAIIMVSGKGEMVYSRKRDQFQWLPNNPMAQSRGEIVEGKDPQVLSTAYGVDDYVSKPFTTDLLIEVINDVLKKKQKQKEKETEEENKPGIG
ncbi:MAG: response regulator [Candidatus Omnitrophota bacterium]